MARRRPTVGQTSFSASIAEFVEQTDTDIASATLTATNELQENIILNTPVDTGAARGSWTVGLGSLPRRYNRENDKDGSHTIAKNKTRLTKLKAGESVFIASNLPYMPLLEYGWSKQAPGGMVRIARARWARYVKNAVKKATGKAQSFRKFR